MKIDTIDVRILDALQHNGRLTHADLADKVGLSASACHRRIKLLEEAGIIREYAVVLSPRALGRTTSVIVQVTLESQSREALKRFEDAVERVDEVMECYLMGGQADYFMRVLVRDNREYERIHQDVLTRLPGVSRLVSNFAIRSVFRRTSLPLKGLAG